MATIRADHEPGERYVGLRIISLIFTWIGVILLIVGTLLLAFGLYYLTSQMVRPANGGAPVAAPLVGDSFMNSLTGLIIRPTSGGAPVAAPPVGGSFKNFLSLFVILWAMGPLGAGLQFLAMGYLIRLAIDVEENTRTSARCLEKLAAAVPRAESPGPFFVS
ncbi:hypothetical protein SAMN05444166_8228 [Singulisphaera sp. GP187]|uniref:hypothetical protein n=1 Tax=Singulisphaera sp. GP187 TaxID=1882752 RepID=UPI000929A7C3|nr:hypothetical protein [Singulisphaera sp. GP187]SIO66805.1 hypothetical protein SAMN05444166_8228 [Singulisphaera sp. GP187]